MNVPTREAIRKHGERLLKIFPQALDKDPMSLCRKLRRLERAAHSIAERICNDPDVTYDVIDEACERVMLRVHTLLNHASIPVFFNRDPRGYALKICSEYVAKHELDIPRDWGGYGLIAPDLTEGN